MKKYEVLVIGSGSGGAIVERCLQHGLRTAWVDKGPWGGTCLNVGCIPSKMLVYPADRIIEVKEAGRLGIQASIRKIDFQSIMERMRRLVRADREHTERNLDTIPNLDVYRQEARFVDDRILRVGPHLIQGEKIFLASGARPLIPPVPGLDKVPYLTNETVLGLQGRPRSLIIIGGGYIACEYAHFFAAMGTKVTILQRGSRLLRDEEPEVSEVLASELSSRMAVETEAEAVEVQADAKGGCLVTAAHRRTGATASYHGEYVLVAAGRKSNADLLDIERSGVATDSNNFIIVNEYLETNRKDIWAIGDAIGKKMFKHAANLEADIAFENAVHGERRALDFNLIPHAVFTHPQIASVGMTEQEAKGKADILVGRARYTETAMGKAMVEERGSAKAIVERGTGRLLGFHIVGPNASILIQEAVNAMSSEGTVWPILRGLHIHPSISELIPVTLRNLEAPSA
jgi:dihydrolipoamide dehydrogenase